MAISKTVYRLGSPSVEDKMFWVVRRRVGHCVLSSFRGSLRFHRALALICELVLVIREYDTRVLQVT